MKKKMKPVKLSPMAQALANYVRARLVPLNRIVFKVK